MDNSRETNFFDLPQNHNSPENIFERGKNTEDTKMDNNAGFTASKGLRMMSKMGYESGTGLGLNKQGIVAPIELQPNLGRRGLGHIIQNLQPTKENWDFSLEEIVIEEKVEWFIQKDKTIFQKWLTNDGNFQEKITIGSKITDDKICNETKYCDAKLVKDVLKAKEILDGIDSMELCRARARANVFETLRSVFFMNRAALKMANIDAATDFLFSGVDKQKEHKQLNNNPYYFADICAGPGGFSEYIFWRKQWGFKGFGMTLRDDNDFKLFSSTCAASETFEPLYGVEDNGDVYIPENIKDFSSRVKSSTGLLNGVHFVMGDGGFSVENQENLQEVLSRQLYVCQCYIALNILKENGHFVVKLFDLFTSFSVGLIYLMSRCFQKIGILKPNSSRPANSERYLICSNLMENDETEIVTKYLEYIVQKLYDIRNNPLKDHLDINGIVPDDVLEADIEFIQFIRHSNKRLAEKQLMGLMKLAAFIRDPTLTEPRQDELRSQCLEYWQIPDRPRNPRCKLNCDELLYKTITNTDFMYVMAKPLTDVVEWQSILSEAENWRYTFSTITERINHSNMFVSLGLNLVYKFDVIHQKWERQKNIELVRGTICFGELVTEYSKHDHTVRIKTLHVIDALRLGDTPLTQFSYDERVSLIEVYCKAVNRQSRLDLVNVRYKEMKQLNLLTKNMLPTVIKDCYLRNLPLINSDNWSPQYNVNSILLIKTDDSQSFDTSLSTRCIIMIPNTLRKDPIEQTDFWESFVSSLSISI